MHKKTIKTPRAMKITMQLQKLSLRGRGWDLKKEF